MKHRDQANYMGYTPREMWPACREEWIDEQIDILSGARERRMALRNAKRMLYVAFMRDIQNIKRFFKGLIK